VCVLLLFPFQHDEKCIDQKSNLLLLMLFTCCRSSHGACFPLTWGGWSREGGNWTRASSPLQGFWPLTLPLPRRVQMAQLIASGASWTCGLQGWGTVGCWVPALGTEGATQCWGCPTAAGGTGTLQSSARCSGQCFGTRCLEVRLTVPSGVVCVCSTSEFLLLCSVLAVVSCIVQ